MTKLVEIVSYNGRLMYRHPLLEELVPAPDGSKLGQRLEIDISDIPVQYEYRPLM